MNYPDVSYRLSHGIVHFMEHDNIVLTAEIDSDAEYYRTLEVNFSGTRFVALSMVGPEPPVDYFDLVRYLEMRRWPAHRAPSYIQGLDLWGEASLTRLTMVNDYKWMSFPGDEVDYDILQQRFTE